MSKYITEQETKAVFRDEIRRMVGVEKPQDIEYLSTSEACVRLNYPSHNSIREAVKNEFFRIGIGLQDRRRKNSIKRLNTESEKRGIGKR